MSKLAVETTFGSLSTYKYGIDSYTASKAGLGNTIMQNAGGTDITNWAGPVPVSVLRPFEYSVPIAVAYPWAMQWSNTKDWVFFADNTAAASSRKFMHATLDRTNGSFNMEGFISLAFAGITTAHTIRSFRMTYDVIASGSVAVASGSTTVSGSNTTFVTDQACIGNRIGFGTTNPSLVSTWYGISAISNNGTITIDGPALNTFNTGSSYVIEDLRAIVVTTNATVANGGLFVAKGLRQELFSPAGTIISGSGVTDQSRSVWWLSDLGTLTNSSSFGAGIEPRTNATTQSIYVLDNVASPLIYKYNLRTPITTVKNSGSLLIKTGLSGAPTGTPSQANNGRLVTAAHGPGSGSSCLYFTTTTRIYRTNAVGTFTNGSTAFIADNAVEVPPGGVNTYAASSLMNSIEYASVIDKFIISVNATTTPFRSYITQYRTDSGQFDRVFGLDIRQTDQVNADSSTTPVPSMVGVPYSVWAANGMFYLVTNGTTAITNRIYCWPAGADWEYAATSTLKPRLISPIIYTPGANKYVALYVNAVGALGGSTGKNLGLSTEDYRAYYRTSGITDDSGVWNLLDHAANLTGVAGATSIQFMFEFRTIGLTGIPNRILSLAVLYEDTATDSHYQPSVANSDITNKRFAWRFSTAFGSTVPTLYVTLYDAVTGGVLSATDNTAAPVGTFQKSTDGGGAWGDYNTTDKANETTYIRYTPASLADNVKVRAVLTQ